MVGVAGRSKGCVTCRKRKKGCDLKRPSCSQCLEQKIQCGGYDLDRVFVRSKYDPIPLTTRTPAEHRGSASDLVALTASTYQVMPTSLARTAFTTKGTEAVFELFPAQEGSGGVLLANSFWQFLASLSMREEPLRQTIFAIGLVALGKGYNDQMVLRKGRTMYGKALQELGASLQNPGRGSFEALLATTRLMGFFEILYGTDGEGMTQAQIWMSHAQGEIALIVSKGPEAFREGPAHLLFTLARYNAAIIGTRSRRHMVFNEEHWKIIPWQAREKPASDTIVDILLEIPEILGELDYLDHMAPDDPRFDDLRLMMLTKCWTVHCNLNAWIARNLHEVYTPPTDEPTPIDFTNLSVASVSLKYWATATLLYQSLDRALRYSVNDTLPPYLNRPHGRPFARLITRSASWLFRKENGAIGPTTLSFPLGVAMMYIRQSGVPDLDYMKLVFAAWSAPEWPRSIKAFLMSMGNTIPQPTHNRTIPENPVTWSTREMEEVADIDGNLLADPFVDQSRYKPV